MRWCGVRGVPRISTGVFWYMADLKGVPVMANGSDVDGTYYEYDGCIVCS